MRLTIHRRTWEFDELSAVWGLKDERSRDIRRLIIGGDLRPFSTFFCELQPVVMGAEGEALKYGEPEQFRGELWAAQEYAVPIGNLECVYPVLRNQAQPSAGARYWLSPILPASSGGLQLTDVLTNFVVSDENRKEVEAARRAATDGLSRRQENTRDKLLCGFAMEYLGWEPWQPGRDLELTKFLEAMEAVGLGVSRNTAKEHLREAWQRVSPKEPA